MHPFSHLLGLTKNVSVVFVIKTYAFVLAPHVDYFFLTATVVWMRLNEIS